MPLEFRMDGAFFQENILKLLDRLGCSFAIKVPFWKWLPLRSLVAAQKRWTRLDSETSCFETEMPIEQWGLSLRVVVYRERVHHKSPRNYQLDLFDPDDGYFEYSAITTNKSLAPSALWDFMVDVPHDLAMRSRVRATAVCTSRSIIRRFAEEASAQA